MRTHSSKRRSILKPLATMLVGLSLLSMFAATADARPFGGRGWGGGGWARGGYRGYGYSAYRAPYRGYYGAYPRYGYGYGGYAPSAYGYGLASPFG
jgi:hypothetical protein